MVNVSRTLRAYAVSEQDGTTIKYLPIETLFSEMEEYVKRGNTIAVEQIHASVPLKDFLAMAATTGTIKRLGGEGHEDN